MNESEEKVRMIILVGPGFAPRFNTWHCTIYYW